MDVDDLRKKSDGDLRIIADMMGLGTSETSGHDELISLISEGGHVKKTARSAASEKRRAQTRKSSDGNEGKAAEKKSPAEKNEINTSIVSKADALDIVNSEIKDNVDLNNGAAVSEKKKRGRPPKNTGEVKIISDKNSRITEVGEAVEKSDTEKKRRGRPKKSDEKPEAESMPSETGRSELSEPEANFSLEESKRAERETDTKKPGKMQKAASEVKNDKKTTNTAERSKSVRKEKRHNAAEKNEDNIASEGKAPPQGGSVGILHDDEAAAAEKTDLTEAAEVKTDLRNAADISSDNTAAINEKSNNEETAVSKRGTEFFGNEVLGILEVMADGYGFLRVENFYNSAKDVYVPPIQIKRFGLRTGDLLKGRAKPQKDHNAYQALFYINEINGKTPDQMGRRIPFEQLIPIYPDEKIVLEKISSELSTRLIDMVAPIGKGQRGMIVSPPKAGKTELMKKIANSISTNYPEIELIVLLIDERPEEVTDMRESVKGTVVSSTFDELPERHIKVSELVLERAQRLVEQGRDVVILMDSLTRLARAYNLTIPPTGRSLSGGLDPGALHKPKKFFGSARNIRGGGSLTIVATALVDTGSRLDDVIFEEFKGTGNMELHLDRKLSEKRIFPAIDISKSGTRKEELLLSESELNAIYGLRKAIANVGASDATEMIVDKLSKSKDNASFISSLRLE